MNLVLKIRKVHGLPDIIRYNAQFEFCSSQNTDLTESIRVKIKLGYKATISIQKVRWLGKPWILTDSCWD